MILPNFLIAGVKKAATTSLYNYLHQHPQVFMSGVKEAKYFLYDPANPEHVKASLTVFPVRTLQAYAELFAGANGALAIGEASPGYIDSAWAAQRIHALIPKVKLIFCLRNPVEREYSSYLMRVRGGYESRQILQALAEDEPQLRDNTYHRLLTPYYALWPRKQIKVILYEEFTSRQVAIMQELYRFLGVDDHFAPDVTVQYNVGGTPRNWWLQHLIVRVRKYRYLRRYIPAALRTKFTKLANGNLAPPPTMPLEARLLLTRLYRADLPQLEELIGLDLSAWGLSQPQE
jgi:hypothetical protein